MQLRIIIGVMFLLLSCNHKKSPVPVTEVPSQTTVIRDFIGKLHSIPLPFRYQMELEDYPEKTAYYPETTDTIFTGESNVVYGYLADTSEYYYIIALYPGDDHVPYLHVIDKSGHPVSVARICIGTCGPGCGMHCAEELNISEKLEVNIRLENLAYECDSEGQEITASPAWHKITTWEGKIRNGRFTYTEKTENLE